MRHAKSSWADASLSDHDRPLKNRGRYDAPRMGTLLYKEGLTPEVIITSSARRAVETAKMVAAESEYEGQIVVSEELYHGDPESYLTAAREHGESHGIIMLVGHNPGVEDLVEQLTGAWQRMPTSALVQVSLDIQTWSLLQDDATGQLVNMWLPGDLKR
ncbi:MAG: SixA phosphatase family protein [Candidatus Promineifilaceae bacterium]